MKKLLATLLCTVLIGTGSHSYAQSYVMHTVQPGDTYWLLSEEHGIPMDTLQARNGDTDQELIAGELLKLKPLAKTQDISIWLNGKEIVSDQSPYMEKSRVFVPIRFIAEALGLKVDWEEETQTAILKSEAIEVKLQPHIKEAKVNDQTYRLDVPVGRYQGRLFVPVRFISELFNCSVDWDGNAYSVLINGEGTPQINAYQAEKEQKITEEDIFWLSRIVEAEAGGESYEGKLAVANVILNRKFHSDYPDTIKEVIFDKNYGYQFSPVLDGRIYNQPSLQSIQAAQDALKGKNNIGTSMYFLNPDKAESFWIVKNKRFYKTLGNHDFYI